MTSPFITICFFVAHETIRFHVAVRLFRNDVTLCSSLTLGSAMHILTASVKETIYLSPIHVYSGLFQSFSLVKQSEIAKGTIIAA